MPCILNQYEYEPSSTPYMTPTCFKWTIANKSHVEIYNEQLETSDICHQHANTQYSCLQLNRSQYFDINDAFFLTPQTQQLRKLMYGYALKTIILATLTNDSNDKLLSSPIFVPTASPHLFFANPGRCSYK